MIKFFRNIRRNLLNEGKTSRYFKYAIGEIVLVVIGILIALQINNWNDRRNDRIAENKILLEISNGLQKDLVDIRENLMGHKVGIEAARFFRKMIANKPISKDSTMFYFRYLTRDYVCVQNTSGYESLKSRGLELIHNDSLRTKIISLYEFEYNILRKLQEDYYELQFQENYFMEINNSLSKNFKFNQNNYPSEIITPLKLEENEEKAILIYLYKIQINRGFIINLYSNVERKVESLIMEIKDELKL